MPWRSLSWGKKSKPHVNADPRLINMNPLNPKKLLLTKWTAVTPVAKQKHFLVSKVIQPELPTDPIELVEIEAVFSKATQVIAWRELQNDGVWRQGWV